MQGHFGKVCGVGKVYSEVGEVYLSAEVVLSESFPEIVDHYATVVVPCDRERGSVKVVIANFVVEAYKIACACIGVFYGKLEYFLAYIEPFVKGKFIVTYVLVRGIIEVIEVFFDVVGGYFALPF